MLADAYRPDLYESLWQQKVETNLTLFDDIRLPAATCFASPNSGYRMRAEFKIWHEGDSWNYVMFAPGDKHQRYSVDQFPIAHSAITALMPLLREAIQAIPELSRRLFQVEFLTSCNCDTLVTLIYHRRLNDTWLAAATVLADKLGIKIVGRAKKQKLCTDRDWVLETLAVNGRDYRYQQVEASFTQPNAIINAAMLNWVSQQLGQNSDDLLELYCGNGNFTLPLSQQFNKVLATEISKTSIASALYNCQINQIDNIAFLRMSSEEFTEALNGVREFRRLRELSLADYNINTVLVDPPRAGLDDGTLALISRYERIIYISCNPQTLQANVNQLKSQYNVSSLAFFDQFPYTDHIETGMLLTKR